MRKHCTRFLILGLVLLLAGCATLGGGEKTWGDMSPKEKSLFFMETYNKHYDDVVYQVTAAGGWDNLGEAKEYVLGKKIEILLQLHPVIKVYDEIATLGEVPDPETERVILMLLNQLIEGIAEGGLI
jgi:hypothetical protein